MAQAWKWNDIQKIFDARNVPAWIWYPIIWAESRGDPGAVGDNGCSIGLFQLNRCVGQGVGYTVEQLKDPLFNATIAVDAIAKAWATVKKTALSQPMQALETARKSGHPLGDDFAALVSAFLAGGSKIGSPIGGFNFELPKLDIDLLDLLLQGGIGALLIGGGVMIVGLVIISFVFQGGKQTVREVVQVKKEAGL